MKTKLLLIIFFAQLIISCANPNKPDSRIAILPRCKIDQVTGDEYDCCYLHTKNNTSIFLFESHNPLYLDSLYYSSELGWMQIVRANVDTEEDMNYYYVYSFTKDKLYKSTPNMPWEIYTNNDVGDLKAWSLDYNSLNFNSMTISVNYANGKKNILQLSEVAI